MSTMCINFINGNAWSIVNCFYYVVSCIFFTFVIDSANKKVIYSSCVV